MPRDFRVLLDDILEATTWIQTYVSGLSPEAFRADHKTVDAVVRNLEIIGEAVKGVPPQLRDQHPSVPWQRIAGLRDILIHQYFGINMDILWDIVQNKLPELKEQATAILQNLPPEKT